MEGVKKELRLKREIRELKKVIRIKTDELNELKRNLSQKKEEWDDLKYKELTRWKKEWV